MKAVCFYLHCLLTYSINISKVYIFPEHLSMYSVYIIAVSVYLFYSIDCISVYSKHAMYTLHRYLVSMLLKFSCIIYCVQPSPTYLLYSMYIYILSLCACALCSAPCVLTAVTTHCSGSIEEGWRQKPRQNVVVLEWGARSNAALRILV